MKVITIPCSFDNYSYLIICEETGEAAVVDPAEFYPIYSELENSDLQLRAIYCTHHHADHIGGLEGLLGELPGLNVYGYEGDKRRIGGMNCSLTDGDSIQVGNLKGEVLHTPGHTTGSLCFHIEGSLFTGDTLFGAGCGRLFEGTPNQMHEALNSRIKKLPTETKVYFGHEYTADNLKFARFIDPDNDKVVARSDDAAKKRSEGELTTPSTLALECDTNPFLRCGEESVIQNVAQKFVGQSLDPLSVFTALRKLKDSF